MDERAQLHQALERLVQDPDDGDSRRQALRLAARLGRLDEVLQDDRVAARAPEPGREPPRDLALVEQLGALGFGYGDPRPYPGDRPRLLAIARRGRTVWLLDESGEVRRARAPDWDEAWLGKFPLDAPWQPSSPAFDVEDFRLSGDGTRLLVVAETTWDPYLDPQTETCLGVVTLPELEPSLRLPSSEELVFLGATQDLGHVLLGPFPRPVLVSPGARVEEPVRREVELPEGSWVQRVRPGPRDDDLLLELGGVPEEARCRRLDATTGRLDAEGSAASEARRRRPTPSRRGRFFQYADARGELRVRPETHRTPITALELGPEGRTLRSHSAGDGELRVWDLARGQVLSARRVGSRPGVLGSSLLVRPSPRSVRRRWQAELVDAERGERRQRLRVSVAETQGTASGGHAEPGAGLAALTSDSGDLVLVALPSGEVRWVLPKVEALYYPQARIVPQSELVLVTHRVAQARTVRLRGLALDDGAPRLDLGLGAFPDAPITLQANAAGTHALVGLGAGAELVDLAAGEVVPLASEDGGRPGCAAFLAEGEGVVGADAAGALVVFGLDGRSTRRGPPAPGATLPSALVCLPGGEELVAAEGHFLRRRPLPR